MKSLDLIKRAGRSLATAKARTILTALAIAVGGFTLTLTLAASNGATQYGERLISSNFDPSELIVGRDKEVSNDGTPSDRPQEYDESITSVSTGGPGTSLQIKRVSQEDVEELRELQYIEQVRESYQIDMRYVTAEGQSKYTGAVEAYNPAQKPETRSGELPDSGDIPEGTILLPEVYLDQLGLGDAEEAIGRSISITVQQPFNPETVQSLLSGKDQVSPAEFDAESLKPKELTTEYKIAGITKKPTTSLSFGVSPMLISSKDAKELYDFTQKGTPDYQKYLFVYARVVDGQDETKLLEAQQKLEGLDYEVQSIKDIQATINQFISVLQIIVTVFGVITLVASVFGVINTQYISVLERTREIGLMKALGMRRADVSRLFILEATWIGFLGGVIGAILALLLGFATNPFISDKLDLGKDRLLVFRADQIIILILILMLVATIAGLLPARKAAKLDPIEALRTE